MEKIANATFAITRVDDNEYSLETTDENGVIELNDLYQYVIGSSITGKYKIKTRTWKIQSYGWGTYYDVDIDVYKNGKQLSSSKYLSKFKYKYHGKWKWSKWGHGSVQHAYHRYSTTYKVSKVKVRV